MAMTCEKNSEYVLLNKPLPDNLAAIGIEVSFNLTDL